jgi:hypothetical protein
LFCLFAIIAAGILSRVVHTGFVAWDKYLGDALYAAMVYALLRLVKPVGRMWPYAGAILIAVEVFQLTLIPAGLVNSPSLPMQLLGRMLGTQFSVADLVAYGVGIWAMHGVDARG